jgi:hypothetical protein
LYNWLIGQRKQGLAITYTILKVKILNILGEADMVFLYGDVTRDFKILNCWMSGFNELVNKFHDFVMRMRIKKSYDLCNILNMDETLFGSTWLKILPLTKKVKRQFKSAVLKMKKTDLLLF